MTNEVEEAIRQQLLKNAIDCTNYVALSNVMAEDIAKKFNAPVSEVKGAMARRACDLNEKFRAMLNPPTEDEVMDNVNQTCIES